MRKIGFVPIRNRYLMMFDIIFTALSFLLSSFAVYGLSGFSDVFLNNLHGVALSVFIFIAVFYVFGVYQVLWVYAGTRDYLKITASCAVSSVISIIVGLAFFKSASAGYIIICAFLASFFAVGIRMACRATHNISVRDYKSASGKGKRLLIVGAGAAATMLVKDILANPKLKYTIVGFIDDSPHKKNAVMCGYRVLGSRKILVKACVTNNVDEIIIAIPSCPPIEKKKLIELCNKTGCNVKLLPETDKLIDTKDMFSKVHSVKIEDLLARDPIVLDNAEIGGYINDKVILVTGGGGSIGSELCRQIMKYNPKKLVIVDIYENNAYELQMELNRLYPDNKPEVVIASVRDEKRLEDIFNKYRPYIVFHAAAHKHVPLMEDSPGEAIKNNVFGTLNCARCADKYGVRRFVMISTDKAVNPTNVMGATKRICEMIVQCMQQVSKTEFVAVRFGNVLGSNGSVIPLFKRQIENGGPVTVTDKRITRFFMTIPEAAQLVLQAASYAKGGEIFVLDMGKPVKIYELAENLIRLSGYRPNVDIKIEVCGLRPGEKLYEELLMNEEGLSSTQHNKIFIGKPIDISRGRLLDMMGKLEAAVKTDDNEKIKDAVAEAVPTYVRKKAEKNTA